MIGNANSSPDRFKCATVIPRREFQARASALTNEPKRAIRFCHSVADGFDPFPIDAIDGDADIGYGLVVKMQNALRSVFDWARPRLHPKDQLPQPIGGAPCFEFSPAPTPVLCARRPIGKSPPALKPKLKGGILPLRGRG